MSKGPVVLAVPKGLTEEELSHVILSTDAHGIAVARGSGGSVEVSATQSQGTFVMCQTEGGDYVSTRAGVVYRVSSIPAPPATAKRE